MLHLIQPDWPVPAHVRCCISTRAGGVSEGPYAGLNLATHVGDAPERVARNRALLRTAAGLPAEPRWLEQVHGTAVAEFREPGAAVPRADGAVTGTPGVVLAVMTADCLPVLLADAAGRRVAALHAGWRGLADGMLEAGVAAMERPGSALCAYLGPAIGPAAFEVGGEVRERFLAWRPAAADAFRPSPAGRWLADLYALARLRLQAAGVPAAQIFGGELCTYAQAERFFSYRREGVTGRMASLIWLEAAS
ncbi:MAG: peptidoglycan editing factor PgeF [Pseudomonadota bacterium]|uniref:peptidoglycan editing factor PgeF n=1 Tax=Thermithiobacillus tepidarius TaxID=929 RepID=UPI00042626B9|nr:peptidoglycan editing factor PgeF [Thermithiobacillus tepidarius]